MTHRVAIVGAGFGGLNVARALARAPVEVVLVDRHNHHTFQPLLYQVATAGLAPQDVAHSVRGIVAAQANCTFRRGTVIGVDWDERAVALADGHRLAFDDLVIAAGATTATFGVDGVEEHGFALKTLADAIRLRTHILEQFERADLERDLVAAGALTVVVVGGGPTGVEMCGALAELFGRVLRRDFPDLDLSHARVVLVEATDGLLGQFHPDSQRHAHDTLVARGVEVECGAVVERVTADAVHFADGHTIPTRTVVWAAGIRVHPLADALGLPRTRGGRIEVDRDLSVPGRPGVWVVGDMAASTDPSGDLYPQMAPVAIQGGRHVARQIVRRHNGEPTERFVYRSRGVMATIGRRAAVAELPVGLRFKGTLGWLLWLFVHLLFLIGFRNRASVLVDWAWSYVTYDRAARVIIEPSADRWEA